MLCAKGSKAEWLSWLSSAAAKVEHTLKNMSTRSSVGELNRGLRLASRGNGGQRRLAKHGGVDRAPCAGEPFRHVEPQSARVAPLDLDPEFGIRVVASRGRERLSHQIDELMRVVLVCVLPRLRDHALGGHIYAPRRRPSRGLPGEVESDESKPVVARTLITAEEADEGPRAVCADTAQLEQGHGCGLCPGF